MSAGENGTEPGVVVDPHLGPLTPGETRSEGEAAAPEHRVLACGGCGETFAGDPAAAFTSPLLAAALEAAPLAAHWEQDEAGGWTCSQCIARAEGLKEAVKAVLEFETPEPEAPAAEPAPETNPYDQYEAVSAELNASLRTYWTETNLSNATVRARNQARIGDGFHNVAGILGGSPEEVAHILAEIQLRFEDCRRQAAAGDQAAA